MRNRLIAWAHIGQGSSVTTRSQSGRRGSPRSAAAARKASNSAWAEASACASTALPARASTVPSLANHDGADRHFPARRGARASASAMSIGVTIRRFLPAHARAV